MTRFKVFTRTPLLLFYLLLVYVLIQFGWWAYELTSLHKKVAELQYQLSESEGKIFLDQLNSKWMMVLGEGAVFLLILLVAANTIRKSFNREKAISIQQKNFLLSVTHELKSPLASTQLQLETLLKRSLTKEQEKEIIKNALSETNRLNALVENILTASRIDHFTFNISRLPADLSLFIAEQVNNFAKAFTQKHVFDFKIQENINFSFDKELMSVVIHNLLENACKYSPDGSVINIDLHQNSKQIILKVSDNGIGIPANERQNIFNKFYRLQNEDTRSTKGTGLGLFITKFLIEKHNGTITVMDNNPKGTTFIITLYANE